MRFEITTIAEVRETYTVDAITEAEARGMVMDGLAGEPKLSEALGMDIVDLKRGEAG